MPGDIAFESSKLSLAERQQSSRAWGHPYLLTLAGRGEKQRLVHQIARSQNAEILQVRLPTRDDLFRIHA